MLMIQNHKIAIDNKTSLELAQELKSPLSSMLGMLDLLLTTAMTAKQKEYLEVACASGQSLVSSIESVITFIEIKNDQIKNVANRLLYASAVVIPLITIILISII